MKLEIEITEEEIKSALERKVRVAIADQNNSWQTDQLIKDTVRKQSTTPPHFREGLEDNMSILERNAMNWNDPVYHPSLPKANLIWFRWHWFWFRNLWSKLRGEQPRLPWKLLFWLPWRIANAWAVYAARWRSGGAGRYLGLTKDVRVVIFFRP